MPLHARRLLPAVPLAILLGCGGAPADAPEPSAPIDTDEAPLEERFSFAIFADPHISSSLDHQERLAAAVSWVNQQREARGLELVVVVGDIGWGGGLTTAKSLLDELTVPYVPVLGDNEVHFGDEEEFDLVFAQQYEALSATFDDWRRGVVETWDPARDRAVWLQNFSFTFGGIHFVGLDWCSRDDNDLLSEIAELNDYEGGTLTFFSEELSSLEVGPDEDVLLFSHHPMMFVPGGFSEDDWAQIVGVAAPVSHRVAAAFAGHLHLNAEFSLEDVGYEVYITDAIWDDDVTVRVVTVYGNDQRQVYEQELVLVE